MRISTPRGSPPCPRAMPSGQNHVAVIGAGPAGLMAAEVLAQGGADVTIYDAMPSAGRKFLMAGRGGLNLTHSEQLPAFLTRYGKAAPQLTAAIEAFPPRRFARMERGAGSADLRRLQRPGVSQGDQGLALAARVAAAARRLGRAIQAAPPLDRLGRRRPACSFGRPMDRVPSMRSATVLALGGASWPRLGSDGAWVETLAAKGVAIAPLKPANCGFAVAWSDIFRDRFEGQPLKGMALSFGPRTVRGEAMITRTGIEGGAIYALSAELREAVLASGRRSSTSPCGPISTPATWSRGCRRREASNRSRTGCARPRSFRPSASACCRKRRSSPAWRCRRCRQRTSLS